MTPFLHCFPPNVKCICLHLFAFYFFYRIVFSSFCWISQSLFYHCAFSSSPSLRLFSLALHIVCHRFSSPDEPKNCVIQLVLYFLKSFSFLWYFFFVFFFAGSVPSNRTVAQFCRFLLKLLFSSGFRIGLCCSPARVPFARIKVMVLVTISLRKAVCCAPKY